jgi:hypothetical protein
MEIIKNRFYFLFIWLPLAIIIYFFEANNYKWLEVIFSIILYLTLCYRLHILRFNKWLLSLYISIFLVSVLSFLIGKFTDFKDISLSTSSTAMNIILVLFFIAVMLYMFVLTLYSILKEYKDQK